MGAPLARMRHGEYVAALELDQETGRFRGRVVNLEQAALDFSGGTLVELHAEFAKSVEIYETACRAAGREPERPGVVVE